MRQAQGGHEKREQERTIKCLAEGKEDKKMCCRKRERKKKEARRGERLEQTKTKKTRRARPLRLLLLALGLSSPPFSDKPAASLPSFDLYDTSYASKVLQYNLLVQQVDLLNQRSWLYAVSHSYLLLSPPLLFPRASLSCI